MSSFSVLNLNIMHGRNRKSPIFPLKIGRQEIQSNLQKIVDLISLQNADVVTLQEVDNQSFLSGGFNQFDFIGERIRYPYRYFSPSCEIKFFGKDVFVSGNAIFSKYPLSNCESFKFDFTFPTDRMGFVLADVNLPTGEKVTVTSLHLVWLDWLRINSRSKELKLVERVLGGRGGKVIVAGDFNCDFEEKKSPLPTFAKALGLQVFSQGNRKLNTSPSWNPVKCIDWVLPSQGMDIVSYKVVTLRVSDHLPVLVIFEV